MVRVFPQCFLISFKIRNTFSILLVTNSSELAIEPVCGAQGDFILLAYYSVASQLASDWDKLHGEQKLISKKTEILVMFVMWESKFSSLIASYIIVSMLMLIHFLTFWENSFKENIGKLCKIRVQSKQRFLTTWKN